MEPKMKALSVEMSKWTPLPSKDDERLEALYVRRNAFMRCVAEEVTEILNSDHLKATEHPEIQLEFLNEGYSIHAVSIVSMDNVIEVRRYAEWLHSGSFGEFLIEEPNPDDNDTRKEGRIILKRVAMNYDTIVATERCLGELTT